MAGIIGLAPNQGQEFQTKAGVEFPGQECDIVVNGKPNSAVSPVSGLITQIKTGALFSKECSTPHPSPPCLQGVSAFAPALPDCLPWRNLDWMGNDYDAFRRVSAWDLVTGELPSVQGPWRDSLWQNSMLLSCPQAS